MPQFSIVIPVFNREKEIRRVLVSCLAQRPEDFEVVVVDDASTDGTVAAVEAFHDPAIKLLRHQSNRGAGAARTTGGRAAKGAWIITLDSDDELMPGALKRMRLRIESHGPPAARFGFAYHCDDGNASPLPALRDETVDYGGYLTWLEAVDRQDYLACTLRSTFESVNYPQNRWTDLGIYHLNFMKNFTTVFCHEVVAWVHTDAASRLSYARRTPAAAQTNAEELATEWDLLLATHGEGIRQYAPRRFRMYRRIRAIHHLLAGHRLKGLQLLVGCLCDRPWEPETWVLLILGMLHPTSLAVLRSRRALPT